MKPDRDLTARGSAVHYGTLGPLKNPPFPAGSVKRMNGLEPSTFCMARTRREATGGDRSRQTRMVLWFRGRRSVLKHQQPTAQPSRNPSHAEPTSRFRPIARPAPQSCRCRVPGQPSPRVVRSALDAGGFGEQVEHVAPGQRFFVAHRRHFPRPGCVRGCAPCEHVRSRLPIKWAARTGLPSRTPSQSTSRCGRPLLRDRPRVDQVGRTRGRCGPLAWCLRLA